MGSPNQHLSVQHIKFLPFQEMIEGLSEQNECRYQKTEQLWRSVQLIRPDFAGFAHRPERISSHRCRRESLWARTFRFVDLSVVATHERIASQKRKNGEPLPATLRSDAIGETRDSVAWYLVPGTSCRLPVARCQVPGASCKLPVASCKLPGARCQVPGARNNRIHARDPKDGSERPGVTAPSRGGDRVLRIQLRQALGASSQPTIPSRAESYLAISTCIPSAP